MASAETWSSGLLPRCFCNCLKKEPDYLTLTHKHTQTQMPCKIHVKTVHLLWGNRRMVMFIVMYVCIYAVKLAYFFFFFSSVDFWTLKRISNTKLERSLFIPRTHTPPIYWIPLRRNWRGRRHVAVAEKIIWHLL